MWYILGYGYLVYKWLTSDACPGPLVKYPVPMHVEQEDDGTEVIWVGSIQRCTRCPYLVTSGNHHDARHVGTPLVEEGWGDN